MTRRVNGFLAAVVMVCLLTGCISVQTVSLAQRTPAACGGVKLYGTANVPFEYEEIGTVAIVHAGGTQEEWLREFTAEAQRLGADAVLNFMLEPVYHSGGFMLVVPHTDNTVVVKGVAVKVKRP